MAYATTFSTTVGVAITNAATANNQAPVQSAGIGNSYPVTYNNALQVQTAGIGGGYASTQSNSTFSGTAAFTPHFTVTPDPDSSKLLKLVINPAIELTTDCSSVTIADATPTYDPDNPNLYPNGYNPEDATANPYRAKRSEVELWFCYRIWTAEGPLATYFPPTQNGTLTPWTFTQGLVTPAMYQIFMIAAPLGTDYELHKIDTLPEFAANMPGWYVTSVGTVLDCPFINCYNTKRRTYLDGIKCGKCDKGYAKFRAAYNRMIAALDVLMFDLAYPEYVELGKECIKIGCNCGCGT